MIPLRREVIRRWGPVGGIMLERTSARPDVVVICDEDESTTISMSANKAVEIAEGIALITRSDWDNVVGPKVAWPPPAKGVLKAGRLPIEGRYAVRESNLPLAWHPYAHPVVSLNGVNLSKWIRGCKIAAETEERVSPEGWLYSQPAGVLHVSVEFVGLPERLRARLTASEVLIVAQYPYRIHEVRVEERLHELGRTIVFCSGDACTPTI